MVCLVIETPLANNQIGTSVLHLLDHISKLLLLILSQFLVLFHTGDIELMLGLGAWRLERTREDRDLRVLDAAGHLRVGHILVNEDTLDERRVSERAANFALHLDEIEWHVFALEVGN